MARTNHHSRGARHRRNDALSQVANRAYAQDKSPKVAINRLIVPCPECKAPVGEVCVNKKGGPLSSLHISRRRMANRKYLEATPEEREAISRVLNKPVVPRPISGKGTRGVGICPACQCQVRLNIGPSWSPPADGMGYVSSHGVDGYPISSNVPRCIGVGAEVKIEFKEEP